MKPPIRIAAERANARAMSRRLWNGLWRFNRKAAGPFRYSRVVLTARGPKRQLLGGLIMQSWWLESFVELLWMAAQARGRRAGRMPGSPRGASRHYYLKAL